MRGLLLALRRGDKHWNRIAQLHHVIHQDLDIVSAGSFKLDLAKDCYVGGMQGGVLQCEFHLAFPQDSRLVGRHESDTFGELADASGPAVEQAELQRNDRHLRHSKRRPEQSCQSAAKRTLTSPDSRT